MLNKSKPFARFPAPNHCGQIQIPFALACFDIGVLLELILYSDPSKSLKHCPVQVK